MGGMLRGTIVIIIYRDVAGLFVLLVGGES
jgi:hypothetical protein